MATALDLKPRPLWDDEPPKRGDMHFAVGFGHKSAFVSRLIAAGTASRTNHVGIITDVQQGQWTIVEALAHGVVEDVHHPPPMSTVMRLSDDGDICEAIATEAEKGAHQTPHIKYDWATICRILFVGLVGRVPFLTFPILASAPLARWVNPVWLPPLITFATMVLLYKFRGLLFRAAMKMPWPNPRDKVICSEYARQIIERVFGDQSLPGLADVIPAMTAPGDLLQELLHRCDYWTAAPRRVGAVDMPLPRRSR